MKRTLVLCLLFAPLTIEAQEQKEVNLQGVTVNAARVITKPDGKVLIPSEEAKKTSANGYALLDKLFLQGVIVDAVKHTVTSKDNRGGVQIRINGAVCTKEELLALNPNRIKSVEYIDNPGVRYGSDIAYVINFHTSRNDEGYAGGMDLTNSLTSWQGDDAVFASWNHKNSEFGITYDFNYQDLKGSRYHEDADYTLNNGSHYLITRQDLKRRDRNFDNTLQLKYNLADSASYVFQALFTTDFSHDPGSYRSQLFSETGKNDVTTWRRSHDKSTSPVLDLYFFHQLGSHQSITANVVGTSIATNTYDFNSEGTDYAYHVDGNTWSLTSEAIYENQIKPFTLSMGARHQLKYTSNDYTGDVNSVNDMHNQSLYFFGEMKGRLKTLRYVAGLGASNERYRQGDNHFSYWLFRPKVTLSYSPSKVWNIRYLFSISQHISQIAMISDTRIRTNSMEWTVGNPNIKPNSVLENDLRITYTKPRFVADADVYYKVNRNCNMASYSRDDNNQFYYMQKIQPHVNLLSIRHSLYYWFIPDQLVMGYDAAIYRFFNKGDDYSHLLTSYDLEGFVKAMFGNWSFVAQAYSGFRFMEGETRNHQQATSSISCGYTLGNWEFSLTWQQPSQAHPRTNKAELVNENIHKLMLLHSSDDGNKVTLGISWKFNRGKRYRDIDRTMNNKDTQTGILH